MPLPSNMTPTATTSYADGHDPRPGRTGAGFCVDVNAITRAGNSFTGDLTIPILFVEDIRARP